MKIIHDRNCEMSLCIFNKNDGCILPGDIDIDASGMCSRCTYIYFPEEVMQKYKKETQKQYLKNVRMR